MVHYHLVGFQLIYCYSGWVRLVYEDQGPAFVLAAGDCVIQPPQIRHRVLEASENLQVIEIGVPAEHVTTVDHEMTLPNATINPDRDFSGQRFCRSEATHATWQRNNDGFLVRDTGIAAATQGVAAVEVWRASHGAHRTVNHHVEIHFSFVLSGRFTLEAAQDTHALAEGDAFVLPPHMPVQLAAESDDAAVLVVRLPA